jgi:hypothetical protein
MSKSMNDAIQSITEALKREKCVLFLGPNVSRDNQNQVLHHQFLINIERKYTGEVKYNQEEGFLFFKESDAKNDVIYDMIDYYKNNVFSNTLFKKIAQIPFHMIVSLLPDTTITQVFEEYAINYEFVDFEKRIEKECNPPTKNRPIIYNLLGMATKGNFILSQDDFYEYLKEIISNKKAISLPIRSAINEARCYIFIGFGYQKWYLRLLMNVLDFHIIEESKKRQFVNFNDTVDMYRELVEKQFKLNFIDKKYEVFIDELFNACQEVKILREIMEPEERYRELLESNNDLLEKYQLKLVMISDPKERMRIEDEIEQLKNTIKKLEIKLQGAK